MQISKDRKYAITNINPQRSNRFITVESTPATMAALINTNTIRIDEVHNYRIYTKNPARVADTSPIHNVRSTVFLITQYPYFDRIISRNQSKFSEMFIDYDKVRTKELKQDLRSVVIIK